MDVEDAWEDLVHLAEHEQRGGLSRLTIMWGRRRSLAVLAVNAELTLLREVGQAATTWRQAHDYSEALHRVSAPKDAQESAGINLIRAEDELVVALDKAEEAGDR